jgi:hypothetical protein
MIDSFSMERNPAGSYGDHIADGPEGGGFSCGVRPQQGDNLLIWDFQGYIS